MAQDELNAADQEKMIGIAILSFISLVTLVFYFFVKNALSVIRVSDSLLETVWRLTEFEVRFSRKKCWRRWENLMQRR